VYSKTPPQQFKLKSYSHYIAFTDSLVALYKVIPCPHDYCGGLLLRVSLDTKAIRVQESQFFKYRSTFLWRPPLKFNGLPLGPYKFPPNVLTSAPADPYLMLLHPVNGMLAVSDWEKFRLPKIRKVSPHVGVIDGHILAAYEAENKCLKDGIGLHFGISK
jgi:hypothetical protein